MTVHRRSARTGVVAIKSLKGARRNVLGTRRATATLKSTLKKPSIATGEPHKFVQRIAPTGTDRKSGWEAGRNRHFQRVIAQRKVRRAGIGHWRRSRKRVRTR